MDKNVFEAEKGVIISLRLSMHTFWIECAFAVCVAYAFISMEFRQFFFFFYLLAYFYVFLQFIFN